MMHFRTKNAIILFFGIALLIIVALSVTSCDTQPTVAHEYPAVSIVNEIDNDTDLVFCTDYNGNVWCFSGVEDWFYGDVVAMLVNDNGTEEIFDDKIISVRYAGSIAVG